jgi:signal transduction histidine kinase
MARPAIRGATALALGLCLPAPAFPVAARPGDRPARTVLVLYQDAPNVPAIVALNDGLRRVLQRAEGLSVFSEHLDLSRFPGPAHEEGLRRWLVTKYAAVELSLVVAVGPAAVAFAARPDPLWPGVPVLFCAVDDRAAPGFERLPGVTGIAHHYPVRETMELALRLLPDASAFALVGGASAPDRFWVDVLRAEAARLPSGIRVVELFGLPMDELLEALRRLPRGTPIFGMTFLRDGAGRPWTGPEAIRAMDPVAPGPIFTTYDFLVGRGAAGGVVLEFERIGEEAGELALRTIAGGPPALPSLGRSRAFRVLLDGRVLERWGIPDARIPPGAEVRFRALPPWKDHPWATAGVSAALVVQAGLILVLLLERRRRRVAETAAGESRAAVAHMNRVGAVGELAGSLAHEINTPLASMQNSARAIRRLLSARGHAVDDDVRTNLGIIESEGQRAGEVIRRMRAALRREPARSVRLDAGEVARDAVALVEPLARRRGVDLRLDAPGAPASVDGDRVQLLQVLLNLLLNAVEAAAPQPPDRRQVAVRVATAGGAVRLQVADQGGGFTPAARARLFEPFFTTREDGLGMGLSISRTIVEAHGGRMWIGDAPGGAEVNVELPGTSRGGSGTAEARP